MVNLADTIDSPARSKKHVILIATDDLASANAIETQLTRRGHDTKIAVFDGTRLRNTPKQPPAAVIIYMKKNARIAPKLLTILQNRYDREDLTFIGVFDSEASIDTDLFDSVIFPPAHSVQIANRVNSMLRLQKIEREISLRINTLQEDFGINYEFSEKSLEAGFRVLFIGKASPEFMVVINALEKKNVEVIAAFTSFSAFDFLHENQFDAVVINMLAGIEPGLTISETMRRNSALYHTPTLFLTGDDFQSHDLAYQKGATDIIPFGSEGEEISGRILELANYHRIHRRLKIEFGALGGDRCTDKASGVYNKNFLYAHLRRIRNADKAANLETSIMLIRISPQGVTPIPEDRLSTAYNQIGAMLRNMVRMEDIIARIDKNIYAVVFPSQRASELQVVVDRIKGVINATAFQSGNHRRNNFQAELDIILSDCRTDEDSGALIERCHDDFDPLPDMRQVG